MSKLVPIGYEKSSGTGFAVFFIAVAAGITALLIRGGVPVMDIIAIPVGGAVMGGLMIVSSITTNRKNRGKIEHKEYMLSCPYAWGQYIETRVYRKGIEDYVDITDQNTRASRYYYRVRARFVHPETLEEITVASELYARRPEWEMKLDRVKVHYSPEGKYWIDL